MDAQDVALLDKVCWFFPDLKIVMRHGGEPWVDLAVKLMVKWPNLYYSTSAFAPKYYPKEIIDYANSSRGSSKIMYAGYYPSGLTLERIFTEMAQLPLADATWPKFLRGQRGAAAQARLSRARVRTRAAVMHGFDQPLRVEEIELDPPGEGEVLLRMVAAGICGSDLHVRQGDVPVPTPAVAGHEGSGVVEAVGPGVSDFAVGDHVIQTFVAMCGHCEACLRGQTSFCANGMSFDGRYADGRQPDARADRGAHRDAAASRHLRCAHGDPGDPI